MEEKENKKIIIIIPIYNDWDSVAKLIYQIDKEISVFKTYYSIDILLVDDGSGDNRKPVFTSKLRNIMHINILSLSRNMGHQRAIAIGLSYIYSRIHFDAVVIMDGDGEDTTEGMTKLIQRFIKHKGQLTVFAKRQRRTEGMVFSLFYQIYKLLTWFLMGMRIEVGNFSIISKKHVGCLVVAPELWNHYAASVVKLKLPRDLVPIDRGNRITGRTSMNFIAFVIHGLSAISVFADEVGVRLMVYCFVFILSLFVGLIGILSIRLFTELDIPGWTTSACGISLVLVSQLLIISLVMVVIALKNRSSADFIPIRDYTYFIKEEDYESLM